MADFINVFNTEEAGSVGTGDTLLGMSGNSLKQFPVDLFEKAGSGALPPVFVYSDSTLGADIGDGSAQASVYDPNGVLTKYSVSLMEYGIMGGPIYHVGSKAQEGASTPQGLVCSIPVALVPGGGGEGIGGQWHYTILYHDGEQLRTHTFYV